MRAVDGLVTTTKSVSSRLSVLQQPQAYISIIGMGHVRLKIIDMTEAGTQPFYDEDSDIHASVNGELYDWEQYREKLSNTHTFKSTCDCEILIALYKQYGLSFLSHLRGEFAFVLWDAKRKLFLAARDRYGIKPLYYTVVSGRLLVATEQKCFLAYGWRPEWDVRTLRDQSWRVESKTYFRGVHRVSHCQIKLKTQ